MNHPLPAGFNIALPEMLRALRFDNRFVRELPGDPVDSPRPRQVRDCLLYNLTLPTSP
jgi:hypothetical protein